MSTHLLSSNGRLNVITSVRPSVRPSVRTLSRGANVYAAANLVFSCFFPPAASLVAGDANSAGRKVRDVVNMALLFAPPVTQPCRTLCSAGMRSEFRGQSIRSFVLFHVRVP